MSATMSDELREIRKKLDDVDRTDDSLRKQTEFFDNLQQLNYFIEDTDDVREKEVAQQYMKTYVRRVIDFFSSTIKSNPSIPKEDMLFWIVIIGIYKNYADSILALDQDSKRIFDNYVKSNKAWLREVIERL